MELARVRCHGFSEHEVAAARAEEMAEAESLYREREQQYSTVGGVLQNTGTTSNAGGLGFWRELTSTCRAGLAGRVHTAFPIRRAGGW